MKLALDGTDIFGLDSTSETYECSAYDGMELQLLLITSKASQACYQKSYSVDCISPLARSSKEVTST